MTKVHTVTLRHDNPTNWMMAWQSVGAGDPKYKISSKPQYFVAFAPQQQQYILIIKLWQGSAHHSHMVTYRGNDGQPHIVNDEL